MEIVSLPVEDWREYRALRLRALKEDPLAFGSSHADVVEWPRERWESRLREAQQGERSWLLFAREGGRLVGMIGAFVEQASPETATIVSVYVAAEERGKRISNVLMDSILRELSRNASLKTVTLAVNNTQLPAMELYKKFGFRPTGTQAARTGNGVLVEEIHMERSLPY